MRFSHRHVVVTGGAGGMGLAVAERLCAEGATVTVVDLLPRPAAVEALAGVIYHEGDLTDEGFVAGVFDDVAARAGRLDGLVNAAGVLWFDRDRSLLEIDLDAWDRVLAVNLKSMVHTARRAVPVMRRSGGGAMVHVSSTQALRGDDRPQDAYQASKAAVIALSKSLAVQLAAERIRSNVLVPGPTRTPMQARWERDPDLEHRTAGAIPLGRVGTPGDMAAATLFLLSDDASWITGTELVVDGGLLALP